MLPGMHSAQAKVDREAKRFNALACGRRWGKTKYLTRRMCVTALKGQKFGYFGANYKYLDEAWKECRSRLSSVLSSSNKTERRLELVTGGLIEFWTLEDEDAGRSRRYHEAAIDEAGLVKHLEEIWYSAIRPTLTDFGGSAWFAGTPKGRNFFATAYALGQDPMEPEWASWQMPTISNTTIPNLEQELEAAKRGMPERLYLQEYEAAFLEDAGGVFRGVRDAVAKGCSKRESAGPYTIGIDLAKVEDFTVLTAMDANGNQLEIERFNQISWERQIAAIIAFAGKYPGAKVYVDSTGVGDPIFERLKMARLRVEGYKLTSQSKEQLINNLAMKIEHRDVSLLDDPVQTEELLAYQYELTPSRNVRMNAPAGMHDDTVIALALAAWELRPRVQPSYSQLLDLL